MKVNEFVTLLFEIEVNAHIMHLQTTSFAQHKALNELYSDMVELRDRFCEAYQGDYGIISGFKTINIQEGADPVKYLEEACNKTAEFHATLKESYLQAIVEDIQEMLYAKKYLLKFLK